jgi:hypothetical protein
VLCADGLVWTEAGDVTVDATGQDDTVVLALLGRLYPDNIVLRPADHSAGPVTAGKDGPSRLVVDITSHEDRPRKRR